MKEVTDQSLIDDLNRSQAVRERLMPKIEKIEDPGALSTFGRSAFNAIPSSIGNLMLKLGLTNPQIMQEALYGTGEAGQKRRQSYEQGAMAHPIADISGSLAGFAPLGGATSMGLRTIPAVGRAVEAAAPSLLKRTGIHALEGGTIGSLYSAPGQEGEGFGMGALLGGALGGPGVSVYRALPNIKQTGRNLTNIESLKSSRNQAEQANVNQQAIIDALKRQYAEQGAGLQAPESITRQINAKSRNLEELQPATEIPYRQTENLLPSPELFNTKEAAQNASKEVTERLRDLHYTMEPGAMHDVQFAKRFQDTIKDVKNKIQRATYDPVYDYAKNEHVSIPRNENIQMLDEELKNRTGNLFERNPKQFEELRNSLVSTGEYHDIIPMKDFLSQWKATRNAANKARSLSRKEGEPDQAYWERESENLHHIADQQLAVLKDHMPVQLFENLLKGNQLWRENVAPLYGNKIYEQSKSARGSRGRGRIDVKNIMHEVRGNEPGQKIVKEIILSDPELNRLALSHAYSNKPEGLLGLNENESEFLKAHPRLSHATEQLRRAKFNEKIIHQFHENKQTISQESHERFLNEERPKQAERQKAIEQSEKIKEEIKSLTAKRHILKEALEKGNVTKANFEKVDSELDKALKIKRSLLNKLLRATGYAAATYGIGAAIKTLMKK